MLKAWLHFYQENKGNLTEGVFEPYGYLNHPDQKIIGAGTTFIYYGNRYTGPADTGSRSSRIYIVNASPSPGIELSLNNLPSGWYKAEISNLLLQPDSEFPPKFLESGSTINYDVPTGCLLTLTRVRLENGDHGIGIGNQAGEIRKPRPGLLNP
jgi:hypothetical protein